MPHPFSGLSYDEPLSHTNTQAKANFASYHLWEDVMFANLGRKRNRWRVTTLKLPSSKCRVFNVCMQSGIISLIDLSNITDILKVPWNHKFSNPVVSCKIPFSAMWSPSFVPKPDDWPEQCEVVGTFTQFKKGESKKVTLSKEDAEKLSGLIEWIESGQPPVFVGFGSMVIKDTERFSNAIMTAAKTLGTRIVVQSSWSKLDVSGGEDNLCHNVGPVSHDWLLPQCCAVIHHGGAGTTAAGLRYGLPTLVCPFFGDQYMWGEMVHRASVGPKPVPIAQLTEETLTGKIRELTSPTIKEAAVALSKTMNEEDGIKAALEHFWSALPGDNMMCCVSVIMGKSLLAKYRIRGNIPISQEVASILVNDESPLPTGPLGLSVMERVGSVVNKIEGETTKHGEKLSLHGITTYAWRHRGGYDSILQGLFTTMIEAFELIFYVSFQFCQVPDRMSRRHGKRPVLYTICHICFTPTNVLSYIFFTLARSTGCCGCLYGTLASPFYVLYALCKSIFTLSDR